MPNPPLNRDEFAVTKNYTYLNHAAVGVPPRRTRDALGAFVAAQAEGGVMGVWQTEAKMPEFRDRIGRFIGASGDEIAVLRNTSDGANAIALGLDWKAGDEVLLPDNEFPANVIPWLALRRHGVIVRTIPMERERLTPDVLRREMTDRTRVVAVSWVSFGDGYRHDLTALAEVAHQRGALFCVDAAQALGAFPVDVRASNIDALYGCGAKWMLALQGVSFFYLRRELLDAVAVGEPGWRSLDNMWDFLNYEQPYVGNASRFEGGTPNFIGALSLERSIDAMEEAGTAAIASHILGLTDRLCEGLTRIGAQIQTLRGEGISSGIVTFTIPERDNVELGKAIQERGIVTTWRASGIRVSPHGYNSIEDIDRMIDVLQEVL